jgi:DNA-binding YbaB/EbfC family protein
MGRGFGGRGGFGGMPDMGKLMRDMQKMQSDMVAKQEELQDARIEATTGGGVVKAVVNGKGRLVGLEISPEAVDPDDVEMLQDLIVTAIREAEERAEEQEKAAMESLTGGIALPPGLF